MSNLLYIIWTKENEIGIPIIDEQHRGLVSAINSFHYFIKEDRGIKMVKPIIMTLVEYIDVHFKTEEPLMKAAGYPDFDNHILLHRKLTEKTARIAEEVIYKGDATIALNFLKEWWLNHINNVDRQYAPYVKKMLDIR